MFFKAREVILTTRVLSLLFAAILGSTVSSVDGAVEGVPTAYAIAMFAISTIALSLPLAWLRLRTGSVWAASVLHAAYNAALYLVADPLTRDTGDTPWFAGESGAVVTLVTVVAVAVWWRRAGERRTRSPITPQIRSLQEAS